MRQPPWKGDGLDLGLEEAGCRLLLITSTATRPKTESATRSRSAAIATQGDLPRDLRPFDALAGHYMHQGVKGLDQAIESVMCGTACSIVSITLVSYSTHCV